MPSEGNIPSTEDTGKEASQGLQGLRGLQELLGLEPQGEAEPAEAQESGPIDSFPREEIVALPNYCAAARGASCNRCTAVCPTQAITVTEAGPTIDDSLCTQCGLCAGVCDAFVWKRATLADTVAWAIRESKEEGNACFTCNEHVFEGCAPRSNVIILPCLGAVPPEFWSAVFAQQVPVHIYCDTSYCQTCLTAGPLGYQLFAYALQTAEAWTGATAEGVQELPERKTILAIGSDLQEGDRRGMITALAEEGMDIATGKHRKRNAATKSDFHEQQERLRAKGRIRTGTALRSRLTRKHPAPRQELIVKAARALPARADHLTRWCSTTNAQLCCASGACVTACPHGARSQEQKAVPSVDATLCNACGVCVAICPHGACNFQEITARAYLLPEAATASDTSTTTPAPAAAATAASDTSTTAAASAAAAASNISASEPANVDVTAATPATAAANVTATTPTTTTANEAAEPATNNTTETATNAASTATNNVATEVTTNTAI